MTEEWRTVAIASDYEVSNLGRVRSLKRGKARVLRPCVNGHGYHNHTLYVSGQPIFTTAHVLVMAAFVGPRPDGMVVRHWDDSPANNELSNLLYGTQADNVRDAVRNGRNVMAGRTHCANGHEFTPENIYPDKRQRVCKACHRAKTKRYLERKRARAAA